MDEENEERDGTMTLISAASTDGYMASLGKGVIGGAAAAGVVGALPKVGSGALPSAIWALPGAAGAGVFSEFLEQQGVSAPIAGITAGAAVAGVALGVALAARRLNHDGTSGAAVLMALGAAGSGVLNALWR